MSEYIYVSKRVALPRNYMPNNLVLSKSNYKDGIMLDSETYEHWLQLKEDVTSKGYIIDIESGYRSYDYQDKILQELIADKGYDYAKMAVALPGHSEHQTGLAIDYTIFKDNQFIDDSKFNDSLEECIYTNSIAHKYGFVVRYPKHKEDITGYKYEPWHLRYVGKELATYLYENNLTLDEYYGRH